jgi:hypothetical protein
MQPPAENAKTNRKSEVEIAIDLPGNARDPLNTNGYRDAITLLSPCKDPHQTKEGM